MTAFHLAERYIGIHELSGQASHPLIQWWHSLCWLGLEANDDVPWCSSFVNGIAWELRLPRSKSPAARSWLRVGIPVLLDDAQVGFDVVILKRGENPQPGPEVTSGASGHVGFYAGKEKQDVLVLGGNQGDAVSLARFPATSVLGVRRLQ